MDVRFFEEVAHKVSFVNHEVAGVEELVDAKDDAQGDGQGEGELEELVGELGQGDGVLLGEDT